jgi:hypothetical protein
MIPRIFRGAMPRRGFTWLVPAIAAWASLASPSARADISFVDSFRNVGSRQTGDGNTLTPNGAFFSAELVSTVSDNYTSVQMTYPGPGSPVSLSQVSPNVYLFQTPGLAGQAAMDAAFPFGTYQFDAANGPAAATSYQYTSDDFAQSLPFLTGADYTNLQGMDATKSFTFHLSPFITGNQASSSFIFLTIFDFDANQFVYNAGFLSATTTSVSVAANTLAPGHHFSYELDFSNRDLVPSPGAQFSAQLGFDVRTSGLFASAAVPEPSALVLSLVGMATASLHHLARRRQGTWPSGSKIG